MIGILGFLAVLVLLWIFPVWLYEAIPVLEKHPGAMIILGLGLLLCLLWKVPKWQAVGVPDLKDRLTIENTARQTLAQILGGSLILAGLYFTAATLELNREVQRAARFTKAIDQLGDDKRQIRLGGIYTLEQISKEPDEQSYRTIMDILTDYIRANASWSPEKEDAQIRATTERLTPAPDIQAILGVLRRRGKIYNRGESLPLNLRETDLRGADLAEIHLEGADLRGVRLTGANLGRALLEQANLNGAQLQGANLWGAQLQGANLNDAQLQRAFLSGAQLQEAFLKGAQLQGANLNGARLEHANLGDARLQGANLNGAQLQEAFLRGAQLQGANLRGAHLQRADLWGAQLEHANLGDARLQGANLNGAQLQGATNLTVEQLSTVKSLYLAQLDPPLLEQIQQQYPQLLESP